MRAFPSEPFELARCGVVAVAVAAGVGVGVHVRLRLWRVRTCGWVDLHVGIWAPTTTHTHTNTPDLSCCVAALCGPWLCGARTVDMDGLKPPGTVCLYGLNPAVSWRVHGRARGWVAVAMHARPAATMDVRNSHLTVDACARVLHVCACVWGGALLCR